MNRVLRIDEEKPEMHISVQGYKVTLCFAAVSYTHLFKVNNDRAVQFRKWANTIVKDYTIQGWAMDSDRLKNGGSVLTMSLIHIFIGNIPLLYWLNQDWYDVLMHTPLGQALWAAIAAVMFISTAAFIKLTQPIEYRR